jgi:hypothetical protein
MRNKIGLYLEIGLFLMLSAWIFTKCHKAETTKEQVLTAPVLKDNEKEKIIIDTRRKTVSVVTRIGTPKNPGATVPQVVKKTEGVRKVVVTETDDGQIIVTPIDKGFIFEPGVAIYYSDRARLGLDVQVAYWHSYGLVLGAGVNMGNEPRTIRAHVAISRSIPLNLLSNTSVFVGVDNKKDITAGLRIAF